MVSASGGGSRVLALGISVALESWLGDGGGSGGDLDVGSGTSSLVDSCTGLNSNILTEVGRVSANLGQFLVEVARVLGVASDGAC